VLMNTTSNRNKDLHEPISLGEKLVMGMIRLLVPPQLDNEKAMQIMGQIKDRYITEKTSN